MLSPVRCTGAAGEAPARAHSPLARRGGGRRCVWRGGSAAEGTPTGVRQEGTLSAGGGSGGWDGDRPAALRDRRPPGPRRRGREPRRLGAGGPLGAGQRSRGPECRAGAPGVARRLRPGGRTRRVAWTGRARVDRGVVGVLW